MDIDFIAAIGGILLAIFIGWAERSASKKSQKTKVVRTSTSPQTQPSTPKPYRAPASKTVVDEKPSIEPFINSSDEEISSITEKLSDNMPLHERKLRQHKELDRSGLRNAVLWSEILQRKF